MVDKEQKKNRWVIGLYNLKTDLFIKCLTITGKDVKLLGVSPEGNVIYLQIRKNKKWGLYKAVLEKNQVMKIINMPKQDELMFYWTINNKLFFVKEDMRRNKLHSIWSINADGTNLEPFFEELVGTTEEIAGGTTDGRKIALNIFDNGKVKSGILEIKTGEIQHLPSTKEIIQAISTTGEEIITIDQETNNYYYYKTNEDIKLSLPITGLVYNLRFCIENEFLVYTKYNKEQPEIGLFDLVTFEKNELFDIKLSKIKNEIILV
jgi:hypothetical protein